MERHAFRANHGCLVTGFTVVPLSHPHLASQVVYPFPCPSVFTTAVYTTCISLPSSPPLSCCTPGQVLVRAAPTGPTNGKKYYIHTFGCQVGRSVP